MIAKLARIRKWLAAMLPALVAAAVFLGGAWGLLCWVLHTRTSLRPVIPMAPDTGVTFLIAAVLVYLLLEKRMPRLQIFGGLLFSVGGILSACLTHSSFPSKVEHFAFELIGLHISGPCPHISVTASLLLALWGLSVLLLTLPRQTFTTKVGAALFGALVVSLGSLCLLNSWLGVPAADITHWNHWMFQISVQTGSLLVILGLSSSVAAFHKVVPQIGRRGFSLESAIGLLVALCLILLFGGVNFTLNFGMNESVSSRAQIAKTYRWIKAVERMVPAIREAENGQRGYLLTGKKIYTDAFAQGLERLAAARRDAGSEHQDWPEMTNLNELIDDRLIQLQASINLKRSANDGALLLGEAKSIVFMAQIENAASRLESRFQKTLTDRSDRYRQSIVLVRKTIVLSYSLAFCIFVSAAFLFRIEIRRRAAVEDQLKANEIELEARIEQRTAELRTSEARYRSMLEQSPIAKHILDKNGFSVTVNPAFERLVGVSAEQMKGYNIWADPQPALQGTQEVLRQAFAGTSASTGPIRHRSELSAGTNLDKGAGTDRWVEVMIYPVKSSEGITEEVVLLCQDVTARELALASVRESEARFRQMADILPQVIWTARPDGTPDYYNARWYEYSGYSRNSNEEQNWESVVHPDDLPACLAAWGKATNERTHYELEFRLWDYKCQEYRWHLARALPVLNADDSVKQWVGSTTNIHDQKAAEEILEQKVNTRTAELQQSYRLLQSREDDLKRSLAERETLFREVHHRVKNNLQVISSLLRMHADSMKTQPVAAAALEESRRRVLSMAMIHERLYSNQNMGEIDFSDCARTLVTELVYSFSLPGRRVSSHIWADQILLDVEQAIPCGLILNELVTNALKYAFVNQKTGEISVSLHHTDTGHITLKVSDNGIGLPEGFNWKASKSMGLPIVDILARQLDGTVSYDRAGGARFTITFPKRVPNTKAA